MRPRRDEVDQEATLLELCDGLFIAFNDCSAFWSRGIFHSHYTQFMQIDFFLIPSMQLDFGQRSLE